jgi:hypothetical protein
MEWWTMFSWQLFRDPNSLWGVSSIIGYVGLFFTLIYLIDNIAGYRSDHEIRPFFVPFIVLGYVVAIAFAHWITLIAAVFGVIWIVNWWTKDAIKISKETIQNTYQNIIQNKKAKADQRAISKAQKPVEMSDAAISQTKGK